MFNEKVKKRSSLSLYKYQGLLLPKCNALHLALLNLIRFIWAHFSSLSRSLWMTFLPSSVSTAVLSSVSSANLLRVHVIPLSMTLIKMLKSIGPKTSPLRDITCDWPPLRHRTIDHNPLTATSQPVLNPLNSPSFKTMPL